MRTSINYSSYSSTTYYAVGRDSTMDHDEAFDKFINAVSKYEGLKSFIESETEDSITYRIPNENKQILMMVNRIAMISYQGCIYRNEYKKACRYCAYQNYCKVVNSKEDKKIEYKAYNEGFKDGVEQGIKLLQGQKEV